ncbi:MAG TPA: hypothetical protein VHV47_12775, partial [Opitutaceae bacterium]|nr:hypothetical protein [Opitutaceae bacterium]
MTIPRKIIGAIAMLAAASALADVQVNRTAFSFTGGAQSYTVPAGANYVVVKVWGAGGSGGGAGGGGGYVTARFNVSAGTVLNVAVGSGGDAGGSRNYGG